MYRILMIATTALTASILLARNSQILQTTTTPRDLQVFSILPCVDDRPQKCDEFGGIQLADGVSSARRLDLQPGTSQNFCLSGLVDEEAEELEEAIVQCQVTSRSNTNKLTLTIRDSDGTELCRTNSDSSYRQACVVTTTTATLVANVASADSRVEQVQIVCRQDGQTACTGATLKSGTASDTFDLAFGEIQKYCLQVESGEKVQCQTSGVTGGDVSLWVAYGDVGDVPPIPADETCFANTATVAESCTVSKSVGTIANIQVAATKPSTGVSITCTASN